MLYSIDLNVIKNKNIVLFIFFFLIHIIDIMMIVIENVNEIGIENVIENVNVNENQLLVEEQLIQTEILSVTEIVGKTELNHHIVVLDINTSLVSIVLL